MRRITLLALFAAAGAIASSSARAELCKKCRGRMYIASVGACKECKGFTSSGAHKLCRKCSGRLKQCEHCRTPLAGAKERTTRPAPPGGAAGKPKDLLLGEADNGKITTARLGQRIVVQLKGNPTTGYSWRIKQIAGDAVRKVPFGKLDYQYVSRATPRPMVGSGGAFRFRFEAVRVGQSTVSLGYARPWERGKPPIKTFEVTLNVEKSPGGGAGQIAAKRAQGLKDNPESFSLYLHSLGKDASKKGFRSLLLVGRKPKAARPDARKPTAATLHITARQVDKIVAHLADSGFLAKARDAMREPIPLAEAPCYLLRVTGGPKGAMMDLRGNLGWGKELQASLSALCSAMVGEPAEALRKIIVRVKAAR